MVSPEDYDSIEAFGESILSKTSEPPPAEEGHDSEEDVRGVNFLSSSRTYDNRLLLARFILTSFPDVAVQIATVLEQCSILSTKRDCYQA